jgi:uncharacterized FlaG/YvyC family protein
MDIHRVGLGPIEAAVTSSTTEPPLIPAPLSNGSTSQESQDALLVAAQQMHASAGGGDPTTARIHVDPETHVVRVQIVSQTSGEVVRQIPVEALARFAEGWTAYVGALLDRHT